MCAIDGSATWIGLEPALERRVLLQVLAVLVERGRTDGLQFTAGELGLEDAGGVDRAFGGTCTDQRVQLVDEQHDVAAGLDLLEHLLQALLEVTAVAAAGHECAEVERVQLLVLERLRHVAAHDLLGEALDDRALADAWLTDQHRVVLGAARQHLHDALDLLLAPDDGVELALAGSLREVATELVEHERTGGGGLGGRARTDAGRLLALVTRDQLHHLLADARQVGAELDQDLRGHTFALTDQAEQDVLGGDVVVAELEGLAERQLQHLLGAGRERDVTGGRLLALTDGLDDLGTDGFERDPELVEGLGGQPLTLVDESEQDVLGADVVVAELSRLLRSEHDDTPRPVGESFEHVRLLGYVGHPMVNA